MPSQKIELYKYNTNGSMQGPIRPNQSGVFESLSAGKYKVKMSYLLSGVGQIRCEIERDVEVTSPRTYRGIDRGYIGQYMCGE